MLAWQQYLLIVPHAHNHIQILHHTLLYEKNETNYT